MLAAAAACRNTPRPTGRGSVVSRDHDLSIALAVVVLGCAAHMRTAMPGAAAVGVTPHPGPGAVTRHVWCSRDRPGGAVGVAHCGHRMPAEAGVDEEPRGALCPPCALMVAPAAGTGPR